MIEDKNFTDSYSPREIADKIRSLGVSKAGMSAATILTLSALAGAFISLGATFFLVVTTGSNLGFGITRLIGGVSFSLGLILVIVAGAELFTGNNLIAMAWASGLVSTRELVRNWILVYAGNTAGCLGTVVLVLLSGSMNVKDGDVARTAVAIAVSKTELGAVAAFFSGVLCNALVCLAVWLAMGGRSVTDKILGIIFPITAFVTIGFEHSIANLFFFPIAIFLDGSGALSLWSSLKNLIVVTAGNIVGGTLLVALVYWFAYLREEKGGKPR